MHSNHARQTSNRQSRRYRNFAVKKGHTVAYRMCSLSRRANVSILLEIQTLRAVPEVAAQLLSSLNHWAWTLALDFVTVNCSCHVQDAKPLRSCALKEVQKLHRKLEAVQASIHRSIHGPILQLWVGEAMLHFVLFPLLLQKAVHMYVFVERKLNQRDGAFQTSPAVSTLMKLLADVRTWVQSLSMIC